MNIVVLFDRQTSRYAGLKDGRIPVPSAGGLLDATFGFLAAATIQLRLGTGVALVPQRNPISTAKEGCTLDLAERRPHRRLDGFAAGMTTESVRGARKPLCRLLALRGESLDGLSNKLRELEGAVATTGGNHVGNSASLLVRTHPLKAETRASCVSPRGSSMGGDYP